MFDSRSRVQKLKVPFSFSKLQVLGSKYAVSLTLNFEPLTYERLLWEIFYFDSSPKTGD